MTQMELAGALKRRQSGKRNIKGYTNTKSFNRLAGHHTAPNSMRADGYYSLARFLFCAFAILFLAVGIFFATF